VDEPPPRLRLGGLKLPLLGWKLGVTDQRPARQALRGLRELIWERLLLESAQGIVKNGGKETVQRHDRTLQDHYRLNDPKCSNTRRGERALEPYISNSISLVAN
jgi:hypothetical protein